MDTILVVNAGSSSLKFQVFAVTAAPGLKCLIKGQVDAIGTRPRLRAVAADKKPLIDRSYPEGEVKDLPDAIHAAGTWLQQTQPFNLVAAGHRVVHGGPGYGGPVLINERVLARLESYKALAPLHQRHRWRAGISGEVGAWNAGGSERTTRTQCHRNQATLGPSPVHANATKSIEEP
jgi:acetate kinase